MVKIFEQFFRLTIFFDLYFFLKLILKRDNQMKNKKWMIVLIVLFPFIMTYPLAIATHFSMKYLVGELAYCLFIEDAILGLRPHFIEHEIDLKTLYWIHGILALVDIGMAFIHNLLSHLGGFAGLCGNIALYGSMIIGGLALVFLSSQLLASIPILDIVIKYIRKIANKFYFSREINLLMHDFAPFIVIFVFIHVLLCGKGFVYNPLFFSCFVGYFVLFEIAYIFYGILRKVIVSHYRIKQIKQLNNNTYSIELVYNFGPRLKIKGGQFIFIHTPHSLMEEYHPFSVVDFQNDKRNKYAQTITLGVKVVGDFTQRLIHLSVGTPVTIKGVFGHFTQPKNHNLNLVAIAGGIGITPCLSLMNNLPKETHGMLIWSLHSKEDLVFQDELTKLTENHPYIKVIIQYSAIIGHLTQAKIRQIAQKYLNNQTEWYLCGPPKMMSSVKHILNNLHMHNLYEEGFIF